ncbi:MAG: adenylate/guanylate cyclase domain-containing response regulator [Pseudomonadota bacterium]
MQPHAVDSRASRAHGEARTILVADDDPNTRLSIAGLLESEGYQIVQAERGEKCLFLSMEKSIDAFLIDLDMPGLDGADLCRRLRAMERHKLSPIICLTDTDDDAAVNRAFSSGADDFVNKPVNSTILKARLTGHLQKQDYMQEMERVRTNLNRYISRRTQTMVAAYSITGVLPTPEEQDLCVLFSDVRGFTQMSQELQPANLFNVLSNHLGMQVDCVYRHGGYIDKFAGDGIMAVFDSDDRVAEACACALEIIAQTQQDNQQKAERALELGIGIHAGTALVGNIGSDKHLDYSVIGETVNLAARLCGCADPMSIVVSERIAGIAHHLQEFSFSAPWTVSVRGVKNPIPVYNLDAN